jgi:hypothetical protein
VLSSASWGILNNDDEELGSVDSIVATAGLITYKGYDVSGEDEWAL